MRSPRDRSVNVRSVVTGRRAAVGLALITLLLPVSRSLGQPVTVYENTRGGVGIEVLFPMFRSGSGGSPSGMILGVTGKFRVGESTLLAIDLPYVAYSETHSVNVYGPSGVTNTSISTSSNSVGNIGFGAEIWPSRRFLIEMMLTVPVMSESADAWEMGVWADFDRFERYVPNVLTFSTAFNFIYAREVGPLFRLRAAPAVYFPTEGRNRGLEVFLNAGAGFGFSYHRFEAGVMFTTWIPISIAGLLARHSFLFSAQYEFEFGTLGALYRLPDPDIRNEIAGTFGFLASIYLD